MRVVKELFIIIGLSVLAFAVLIGGFEFYTTIGLVLIALSVYLVYKREENKRVRTEKQEIILHNDILLLKKENVDIEQRNFDLQNEIKETIKHYSPRPKAKEEDKVEEKHICLKCGKEQRETKCYYICDWCKTRVRKE